MLPVLQSHTHRVQYPEYILAVGEGYAVGLVPDHGA